MSDTAELLSSVTPFSRHVAAPPLARIGPRLRPVARRVKSLRREVLGDVLFRHALLRERRQADRLDRPFVLLLVAVSGTSPAETAATWARTIDALSAAKRQADVLGWFQRGTMLGVILPEIAGEPAEISRRVEARVRRELGARLDTRTLQHLAIRLHVHAVVPGAPRADDPPPVDALLDGIVPGSGMTLRAGLKRAVDIGGSLALLTLLSPVFGAIAAAVKLSSKGPALFTQTRVGQRAEPFTMLKFRSMNANADQGVHQAFVAWFIKASETKEAAGGDGFFKLANDTRVTTVGGFLRKTSLDELPQLWNVLRGDMSLVGPRPPLPFEVERYRSWHRRRVMEAKPGMTGLWQVKGRSRTTFDEMVRLDLQYARTCSLWTDIKILIATPKAVISGKGAR